MSDDKKTAVNFDAVADALAKLAEKPNVEALTVKQQLREPKVYEGIKRAKAAGYKPAQIVGVLAANGIATTEQTFRQYWREIEREDAGETKVKPDAKPKTNKPRTASATETPKGDTPKSAEANGGKPDGKPLTKKPAMGGAFDQNNL